MKTNSKKTISLVWLVIGIVAVIAGIIMKAPDVQKEISRLVVTNSSNTFLATAIFEAAQFAAINVLKYLVIIAGVIIVTIASIGFAGACDNEAFEKLMYDEEEYIIDEEECDGFCEGCEGDCSEQPEGDDEAVAEEEPEKEENDIQY